MGDHVQYRIMKVNCEKRVPVGGSGTLNRIPEVRKIAEVMAVAMWPSDQGMSGKK